MVFMMSDIVYDEKPKICLLLAASLNFLNNKEYKYTDVILIIIANSVGEINEQTKVILVVSATLVSPKKNKI